MAVDRAPIERRHWFVCEPQSRWLELSRRFAPDTLASSDQSLSILAVDAPAMVQRIGQSRVSVALWSLETESACRAALPQLGRWMRRPAAVSVLHLVAVSPLLDADARCQLLAWPVTLLDRPEQLPRLEPLIRRFWQRHAAAT
ncbi:hypothetical protein [Roseimaritima sediminicola]|uniref:hypothetical protein n=1 Tax=Roseimaritima sediminicola TaxID=2662066 RepID=UPI0012984D35|nr:hypothetical protein [Roseimaritima sediminicola]